MRRLHAPHLGRSVVVGGRRRPSPAALAARPPLRLARYLDPGTLPTPPTSIDYTSKASAALSQVYANDRLGCCVIAGYYHEIGVWTGNATGTPFVATDAQIIADYEAIGGYNPADPSTDQGCDEFSALQHWKDHPAADGSQLAGFVQLDACNRQEMQIAAYLFGSLYCGIELPDAWIRPSFPSPGFTWDVAGDADPNNGHCVMGAGYDTSGVTICTWGMLGTLTWGALARYCADDAGGMLFAMLSPDWLAKGQSLSPSGVNWDALRADLDALATPAPPLPAS